MGQITAYLERLVSGQSLSFEEAGAVLDAVFEGDVPEVQVAALLTAIRAKGVTVPELAGLAGSLRAHAVRVDPGLDDLIDVVGTGGARIKFFNISTAASLVAAGAGANVAKHGNRAITSRCGAADVLTELGVNVAPGPRCIEQCIRQAGVGFMFAPAFHPAMKYVQPVRKALGFRTVFNILGPLANPARVKRQMTGVADHALMRPVAEALGLLGIEHAVVVHSDGLDEVSLTGPTTMLWLENGQINEQTIRPEDVGMTTVDPDALQGGDATANAAIIRDVVAGKEHGPKKDIVVLNAAVAIMVAGLADDPNDAVAKADAAITDGRAQKALETLITVSNQP